MTFHDIAVTKLAYMGDYAKIILFIHRVYENELNKLEIARNFCKGAQVG